MIVSGSFLDGEIFVLEIIARIQHSAGIDFRLECVIPGLNGFLRRELPETVQVAQLLERHGVAFVDINPRIIRTPAQ